MGIAYKPQFEPGNLRRWVALTSILLILVFNTLEAAHAHAGASGSSSRCVICISGFGNTPAVAVHPVLVLRAVAMVAVGRQPQRYSAATERTLFIRPPPSL